MVENKLDLIFKAYDVRGVYGDTLTEQTAYNIGIAFSKFVKADKIIIGHDGRTSNLTIFNAVASGIESNGKQVYYIGTVPTDVVYSLSGLLNLPGLIITASHNPHHDNGLKLFGPDGMKLSDKIEKKIENLIEKDIKKSLSNPEKLGRVKRLESGTKDYLKILKKNFSKEFNLRGLRIVIDCANGAGYKAGPELLRSLGAKVISIGINPNGLNINNNCGSTYPNKIKFAVKKNNAHLGISLDGDADRIIMCDEKGNIIDGDQIIAALATRWKNKKMLRGGVVGTLMSNYGLEKFFKSEKIKFIRANVGDRYVKEKMKKNNFNLGGEQSGHIILGKFATTGDGLLVALEVLFAIRKGKKASDFFNKFQKTPQILKNIEVKDKEIIKNIEVKKSIKIAEKLIKGKGRILVRKSGTESKIRVMAESNNKELLNNCINIISKRIK